MINFIKTKIDNSENLNIHLDSVIAPSALNEEFYENINSLGPFGSGNSEPKFVIENLRVIRSDIIKNNHIKLLLCGKDGSVFKSFAWNAINSPLESFLNKNNNKIFSAAGKMRLNEWHGRKDIEFIIDDIAMN